MRTSSLLTLSVLCLTGLAAAQTAKPLPYLDPSLPKPDRAADLVSRMTLDEKVSQMMNASAAIPRLNVPAYNWWNEGLHGVARSGYATLFPQAIGIAATWDEPLVKQIGSVISTEARAKNKDALAHDNHSIYFGLTFWSPNINIFRDPRWGRGQETYGEDPFLTARMGVNFVEGMQGANPDIYRVIATPKHFAVHSGPESERHRFDATPSPHDLWDTYLPAFRAAITEAKADSIMCSYNALYGKPACGSDLLLKTTLRGDWGFQGFVTSDCGAVDDFYAKTAHHTSPDRLHADADAVHAGTDTECGESYKGLAAAVKKDLLTEADLDVSLRRLFLARMKLGLFDPPELDPYAAIPMAEVGSPAHRATALEAADKSMVLLKNDGILPLAAAKYKTIAVIGPNAAAVGGLIGNYNAIPDNPQLPLDALRAQFPAARILYAQGAPYAEGVSLPMARSLFHPAAGSAVSGLKAEYFATEEIKGAPAVTRVDPTIDFDWTHASPAPGIPQEAFSVRWSGTLTLPQPGSYQIVPRISDCYPCNDTERYTLTVDGKQLANFSSPTDGAGRDSNTPPITLSFNDTASHTFVFEYHHQAPIFGAGITLDWTPPTAPLRAEAVAAAKKADLVIAMVGLTARLEGEEMPIHVEGFAGGDRTDIKLPAAQELMLEAVAATGKPLVVVLLNGSALAVNWADRNANAILEAWYPGQAGGMAIAHTLAGKNNPAGRLPVTFYRSVDDIPAFTDYAMKGRTYRYFTGTPLYSFGYGLSYTKFAYSNLKLSTPTLQAGDPLTVEADIKNTGTRAGDEVAELYLTPPREANGGLSPQLALIAFNRIHLTPGQLRHVTFKLDPRALSLVNAQGTRAVQPGAYTLSLGGAQPQDIRASTPAQTAPLTITGTSELPH